MSWDDDLSTLRKLLDKKQLEPYIKHVRFPVYKKLSSDAKLELSFPITVLVGRNGTNKSSVLQAIYGAPANYNVGDFWFETATDSINNRSCFIYGYFAPSSKIDVEVIKTRIQRTYKGTGKINPDYWEPSRPIRKHGMDVMPTVNGEMPIDRSKTRWNPIEKNVVYLDFRSEISAFDKCLYHSSYHQKSAHNSKQDLLRKRSEYLKRAIDQNTEKLTYYSMRVRVNKILSEKELAEISYILGKKYSNIRILEHDLFGEYGSSAILQVDKLAYSEAYAGSGEFAIVKLVSEIYGAPDRSLIILDEPEVSLHPGAQRRLLEFLVKRTKQCKHQIVIGTHSPFFVRGLPSDAIKVLYESPASGHIDILNQASEVEAFFQIEIESSKKFTIYVEDPLAKKIIESVVRDLGEAVYRSVNVKNIAGGAGVLVTKYLPSLAVLDVNRAVIILDGDQDKGEEVPTPKALASMELDELETLAGDILGGKPEIFTDGNSNGGNLVQRKELILQVFQYIRESLRYLPGMDPESLIWENVDLLKDSGICKGGDYKKAFLEVAKRDLGLSEFEEPSGEQILFVQQSYLSKVSPSVFSDIKKFICDMVGVPE